MAGAAPCEMDKQGRTLIPATLREFAQMKKEVVLTGMADRIEIWSKEKWIEDVYKRQTKDSQESRNLAIPYTWTL